MFRSVRTPETFFLALTGSIYTAALLSFAHPRFGSDPLSVGFALDLVFTVPLLAYLLPVRRVGWPLLSLPVLALLGLATVVLLGPARLPFPLRSPETLLIALEAALLGSIGVRAARAWRSAPTEDAVARLRSAARGVIPIGRAADVLAHELAVVYYALLSWRARASVPTDAHAFSYHRRCGYGGIVFALLVLSAAEGAAVHLLLAAWSEAAAWVLTLFTGYGALWLVADYRASLLRPVLLTSGMLRVRTGLRWSIEVPRSGIAGIQRTPPSGKAPVLRAVLFGSPTLWIQLREPTVAHGPYGFSRTVQWIALAPDVPESFTAALASGTAERVRRWGRTSPD